MRFPITKWNSADPSGFSEESSPSKNGGGLSFFPVYGFFIKKQGKQEDRELSAPFLCSGANNFVWKDWDSFPLDRLSRSLPIAAPNTLHHIYFELFIETYSVQGKTQQ